MSAERTLRKRPAPPAGPAAPPAPVEFRSSQTEAFVALLHELRASLLVSTYQANKFLAVRASGDGLSTLVRSFERPMEIAADGRRLAVGARNQVWLFRDAPDIAPWVEPAGRHDACYLPRSSHVTGDIGVHELAWAGVVGRQHPVQLDFQTAAEEIFVAQLRPGVRYPEVIGFQKDDVNSTFVVPPATA